MRRRASRSPAAAPRRWLWFVFVLFGTLVPQAAGITATPTPSPTPAPYPPPTLAPALQPSPVPTELVQDSGGGDDDAFGILFSDSELRFLGIGLYLVMAAVCLCPIFICCGWRVFKITLFTACGLFCAAATYLFLEGHVSTTKMYAACGFVFLLVRVGRQPLFAAPRQTQGTVWTHGDARGSPCFLSRVHGTSFRGFL